MKKAKGYTLIEILVAAGILSAFIGTVFIMFRQLTNSYRIGEWKASRQKEIQILLATLKEDLEKANSAYIIRSNGEASLAPPQINVNINALAFNQLETGNKRLLSTNANQPVAYFAIIKSAVEASAYSETTSGRWQGCSLVLTARRLTYQRTGDFNRHTTLPISMPGAIFTAPNSGVAVGGTFEPNNANDFFDRIEDVNSIAFFLIEDGDKRALKIVVECVLLNNGLPASNFTESTVAAILRDTKVISTGM